MILRKYPSGLWMWKVPFRAGLFEHFGEFLRACFWCHVVRRIFPDAVCEPGLVSVQQQLISANRLELLRAELDEITELAIWMSGSKDFSPGGVAYEGWVKMRHVLRSWRHPAAAWPQPEAEQAKSA